MNNLKCEHLYTNIDYTMHDTMFTMHTYIRPILVIVTHVTPSLSARRLASLAHCRLDPQSGRPITCILQPVILHCVHLAPCCAITAYSLHVSSLYIRVVYRPTCCCYVWFCCCGFWGIINQRISQSYSCLS